MFAEHAFELIKELDRSPENMPPFNVSRNSLTVFFHLQIFASSQDEIVRQVRKEINAVFEENHRDA